MSGKSQRVGDYILRKQLGAGQFGVVYLSADVQTGEPRAVKVLKHCYTSASSDDKKSRMLTSLETEIKAMRVLDSEHIVKLHDAFYTKTRFYLVMEYCDGGDLQHRIQAGLARDEALRLFRQLAVALKTMHQKRIMHRDLKPANILLHQQVLKLADFGLAKEFSELTRPQSYVGTLKYMAPEVLALRTASGGSYTEAADLWSAGVILYEMLTGEKLFTGKDEPSLRIEQEQKARSRSFLDTLRDVPEECRDLLGRVLVFDAAHRISLEDFYSHPCVTGFVLNAPMLDFSGLTCLDTKSQAVITVLAMDIAEELSEYAIDSQHPFVFYLKACQILAPHISQDKTVREAFQLLFAKLEASKTASAWESQHGASLLFAKALEIFKEADRYAQLLQERQRCYRRVLHLLTLLPASPIVDDFRTAVLHELSRCNPRSP